MYFPCGKWTKLEILNWFSPIQRKQRARREKAFQNIEVGNLRQLEKFSRVWSDLHMQHFHNTSDYWSFLVFSGPWCSSFFLPLDDFQLQRDYVSYAENEPDLRTAQRKTTWNVTFRIRSCMLFCPFCSSCVYIHQSSMKKLNASCQFDDYPDDDEWALQFFRCSALYIFVKDNFWFTNVFCSCFPFSVVRFVSQTFI